MTDDNIISFEGGANHQDMRNRKRYPMTVRSTWTLPTTAAEWRALCISFAQAWHERPCTGIDDGEPCCSCKAKAVGRDLAVRCRALGFPMDDLENVMVPCIDRGRP